MNILKWFLIVSAGILLMSCDSADQESKDQADTISKEAQNSEQDDIVVLNAEIVDEPNNPNLYIQRAYIYRDRKMLDLAIRDAERAIAIDSTVSYFRSVLGELQFNKGNLHDARVNLKKAVELDNTNTDALLKLGEIDFLLRRYEEALENVNKALRQNDKLAQAYFIKGYVYKELGDTTLSRSSFQTATEVDPEHFDSYMQLGGLLGHQGNPLALEYFNTALSIRPKSAEALYNKGMFLQAGGKFKEAKQVYEQLIEVDPDNFLGYYNSGYLYLTEFQKYDSALYYFDQVLALEPGYIDAEFNRGVCFEQMGENQKAIAIYRKVLQQDPQYTLAAKGLERLVE